jgi:hypothetical protein
MTVVMSFRKIKEQLQGDDTLDKYPDAEDVVELSPRLLYSSSLVEQTYYSMYGNMKPANMPGRYIDLAVLQKRLDGVGVNEFSETSKEAVVSEVESDSSHTRSIPEVWKVSGSVRISLAEDVDSDEMCSIELDVEADDAVFTAYGSLENFHPHIQSLLQGGGTYTNDVLATAVQITEESFDSGQTHFCQLVLESESEDT